MTSCDVVIKRADLVGACEALRDGRAERRIGGCRRHRCRDRLLGSDVAVAVVFTFVVAVIIVVVVNAVVVVVVVVVAVVVVVVVVVDVDVVVVV